MAESVPRGETAEKCRFEEIYAEEGASGSYRERYCTLRKVKGVAPRAAAADQGELVLTLSDPCIFSRKAPPIRPNFDLEPVLESLSLRADASLRAGASLRTRAGPGSGDPGPYIALAGVWCSVTPREAACRRPFPGYTLHTGTQHPGAGAQRAAPAPENGCWGSGFGESCILQDLAA